MEEMCKTCEKRHKSKKSKKRGCQAFNSYPCPGRPCWAWTDNPEWGYILQKQVEAYFERGAL